MASRVPSKKRKRPKITMKIVDCKWVDGCRLKKKDAAVVDTEFNKIRSSGKKQVTAKAVLSKAKNAKDPLHRFFEWDDAVAGEKYRLDQARYLIRSLVVTYEYFDPAKGTTTTVDVKRYFQPEKPGGTYDPDDKYRNIAVSMNNPRERQILLAQALKELDDWRKRWAALDELQPIFNAATSIQV